VIFDTDVLINIQRGNPKAAALFNAQDDYFISAQTYLELFQKARNKEQLQKTKNLLKEFDIRVLPLTENIGHRAMIYIEQFGLSHSLGAGDAIIAATAIENGMPLISCNEKHFKAIKELDLVVFKP
jgi:hypothetical protein